MRANLIHHCISCKLCDRQFYIVQKPTCWKSDLADRAGIEGCKTNHSARKNVISRLVENINPLHIAQLS